MNSRRTLCRLTEHPSERSAPAPTASDFPSERKRSITHQPRISHKNRKSATFPEEVPTKHSADRYALPSALIIYIIRSNKVRQE
jgi:hypothetical protein